jgi:hypothetical protein
LKISKCFFEASHQHRFSLNVWAGIVDNHLIGPHILPNRLRVDNFLNFLENELDNLLDAVPLATRRDIRIQMDGAGPHYAIRVREWFNNR